MYLYHWKCSIVLIYICPITQVLILEISVVNTCNETIDCFRLSNNAYNLASHFTSHVSYSETKLHKTSQQYNIYWILWMVTSLIFYLFCSLTWVLSIAGYGGRSTRQYWNRVCQHLTLSNFYFTPQYVFIGISRSQI